jgi:hypothetical protein
MTTERWLVYFEGNVYVEIEREGTDDPSPTDVLEAVESRIGYAGVEVECVNVWTRA